MLGKNLDPTISEQITVDGHDSHITLVNIERSY